MNDGLRKIGKHINKQLKDINTVLANNHEHFYLVERSRDIIDSRPFEMEFEIFLEGNGVVLDIQFLDTNCIVGEG